MPILAYALDNWDLILRLTGQHVGLVLTALGAATATGVPLGIALARRPAIAGAVIGALSALTTVPSIALFGLLLPILAIVGQGIGPLPAVIAVFLYAQLPIVRNTVAAISGVDPMLRDAARGMGMTRRQRLRRVELPLAVPVILAGIRTALVTNIGVMTIAAYVGAGGLGVLISRGISQTDPRQLVTGALAVSLLAVLADLSVLAVQHRLSRRAPVRLEAGHG
ncbi:ABC transporter permease [Salinarimonas soli]|uniref:ABC transporter permease n=1 Tax=Salinarimonas soli TaxID=1638099 RepID=A0A5B2V8D7_9HYPH|nr:ABC transporter permease [Salinarimonas soli]KAA2234835.1 ABC transporter permease [Salinarimonas soli]